MAEPRDRVTRKANTLTVLATPAIDVWVATASGAGAPYLVPLSLAWVDELPSRTLMRDGSWLV